MPWKDTMQERHRFIVAALAKQFRTKRELFLHFGVSSKTGYKWLKRHQREGLPGLRNRKPVARRLRHALSLEEELVILDARVFSDGAGPRKIRHLIWHNVPWMKCPSASTIGHVLARNGALDKMTPQRRRPTPHAQPLRHARRSNDVWCADFKGDFLLKNGRRCWTLTITDAYSRYLLAVVALPSPNYELVRAAFEDTFRRYGLPKAIRTDNGTPFTGTRSLGGISQLSAWWLRLGIWPERIEPGRPDQNGRHERMHLTLEKHSAREPAETFPAQQRQFDGFEYFYNRVRPHEALTMKTPADVYRASRRVFTGEDPILRYPRHFEVRIVARNCASGEGGGGQIKWRSQFVFISSALGGQQVGLTPRDDGRWVVYYGPIPIGLLNEHQTKAEPFLKPIDRRRTAA